MTEGHSNAAGNGMAVLSLLVMGGMWGLQFAMLKLAAQSGIGDLLVLMATLVLLSAVFIGLTVARGETFRIDRGTLVFFLVTSVLGYVVPLLAALFAASELSAGMLSLIACMAPVVATLAALVLRSETVSRLRIVGVALGVASVSIILLPEFELPDRGKLLWMLVALAVPLSYGIESIYIDVKWPEGLTPLQVVTGETVVATVVVAPILAFNGAAVPDEIAWGGPVIAILVFVGAGVIESLLYFRLIRQTGGVLVNFGTFVSLFAGIAWGIVLFAERHPPHVWIAAAVLVAALYLANKQPAYRSAGHPPANTP